MTDTTSNEPELLAVIQADREAAAAFFTVWGGDKSFLALAAQITNGQLDDHTLPQAFARHRLDTRPTPAAVGGDVLRAAIVEAKWKIAAAVQAHSIDGVDGPPTDGEIAERAMQEARAAYDILSAALAQPQPSGGVDEARALLAAEYEAAGVPMMASLLRSGQDYEDSPIALRAIQRALSNPPSEEMTR